MSAFLTVNSQSVTTVCMICHRVIGPDQRPSGTHIKTGALVSHGVCLPCAPAYCRDIGLSEVDTARVLRAGSINAPIHGGASANHKPETVSTVS